ncbi:MAG: hypothetical protein OXH09_16275 [Gammaproteobacteria bacterium]|nr:hypothetical protein [Gammaproteobacteria bacterium]
MPNCGLRGSRRLVASPARVAALTFAMGCVLGGAFGSAADPRSAEVEELLSEAVRASSNGDFQTSWTSHRRAWQLAFASAEAGDAMRSYCERHDCPEIRKTAWLLGKPIAELAFLTELADYCRDGESDSCDGWFARMHRLRAHLGTERRSSGQSPQDVAIRFPRMESGDARAATLVAIGGERLWALLDSGSPHTIVGRDWANLQGFDYAVVGDPYTQRLWDGVEMSKRIVVLHDVELGSATEGRTLGVAYDGAGWNFLALGMDMLLRYRAACFAWSDGTLHLGRLGPCAGGQEPFGARLDPASLHPTMAIPAPDGSTVRVGVDTGSRDNHCKQSLAEQLHGRPLAFGDHPALRASCGTEGKWPYIDENLVDGDAMTIGMETLSTFDAFGWNLDPFQMYFVPRTGSVSMGSQAETQAEGKWDALTERLERATRAVHEGDFRGAFSNLRQAHWTALSSRDASVAKNSFCARRSCPDIYRIAWLAGRSSSDLDFLGGICKDIEVDTCAQWLAYHRRGRTHLGPARRPAWNPAQDLPLIMSGESSSPRPRTVVEVAGKATGALLNTGARNSVFRRKLANMEAVDYDVVGDPYTETRRDGTERQAREVVLRNLTLGGVTEPRVLAVAHDDPDAEFELGMDILLRYPAACFALADDRLHLGRQGPCADGRAPLGARLDPKTGKPTILVPGPDGEPVTVLLDTGAQESLCKPTLADRLQGVPLRLGGHTAVEAGCAPGGDRLPDDGDAPDMVLGMDWLSRFEAFGWELAPFRLYFVPASAPP